MSELEADVSRIQEACDDVVALGAGSAASQLPPDEDMMTEQGRELLGWMRRALSDAALDVSREVSPEGTEVDLLKRTAAAAQRALEDSTEAAAEAEATAAAAQEQLAILTEELAEAEDAARAAEDEARQLRSQLEAAEATEAGLRASKASVESELVRLRLRLAASEDEILGLQTELGAVRDGDGDTGGEADARGERLWEEAEALRGQLAQSEAEVDTLRARLSRADAAATAELEAAQAAVEARAEEARAAEAARAALEVLGLNFRPPQTPAAPPTAPTCCGHDRSRHRLRAPV